jgi:hypothetical protein
VAQGQSTTFVDGQLWAVAGDPNSHGGGALHASLNTVYVEGIPIIIHSPDSAAPDGLCPRPGGAHCAPSTAGGSGKTFAGGG